MNKKSHDNNTAAGNVVDSDAFSDDGKDYYTDESSGQKYPRPFDYLNYFKEKKITVLTSKKGILSGILKSFDLNINIGMVVNGKLEFIQGESIILISSGEDAAKIIEKEA